MEAPNWPENLHSNRKKAIHELVQGQEWTDKLREVLGWSGSTNPDHKLIDELVVQILGMFESTLSIMGCYSVDEQPPLPSTELHAFCSPKSEKSNESPGTVIPVKMKRGCYKRRKNTWTSTKVTSVLIDDGHAWRKYGQKEILNSKHQRSYYRCTYKLEQGCLATKQVQKMEDKPAYYKITYFGHHTCTNLQRAPPIILDMPDPRDTSILLNFGTKGLNEKKQAGPYFPTMKNEHSMGTPVSSNTYQSWNQSSQIPIESVSMNSSKFDHVDMISWNQSSQIPIESVSMNSSKFDHVDMISPGVYSGLDHGDMTRLEPYLPIARTTLGYELEHMIGMNAFNEFPY